MRCRRCHCKTGVCRLYTLDIGRTLAQFSATPPLMTFPSSEQLTVNAFTRPTWEPVGASNRDDCLARASDSMRSWVSVAFFNPPGGHLINGRQRRPWLQP